MPRVFSFAVVLSALAAPAAAQPLTIAQAIDEALQHNLALYAERSQLTVAEAQMVGARLRPNPVVSFSADHLDLLGTGFDDTNNGGPPEIAWRIDVPFERGAIGHGRSAGRRQRVGDRDRIARRTSEQHAQFCRRRRELELGAHDGRTELQHRNLRARRLEGCNRSGRDTRPVDADEIVVGSERVGRQRTRRFGCQDIDARQRDLLAQRSHGIRELRLRRGPHN